MAQSKRWTNICCYSHSLLLQLFLTTNFTHFIKSSVAHIRMDFFSEPFQSTLQMCLLNLSEGEFSKNEDILLHNHSAVIKIRKFNVDIILLSCSTYSNFDNCLNTILCRSIFLSQASSTRSHIAFSCHVFLAFFNLEHSSAFLLYWSWYVWRQGQLFWRMSPKG